ncbi:hypothetical protein LXA43DRAFT_134144 [Ganoderma leucocontextum]|nr:hypothetical protein LXA43DRAFT_134144 [Ganoderma leucocontextum]
MCAPILSLLPLLLRTRRAHRGPCPSVINTLHTELRAVRCGVRLQKVATEEGRAQTRRVLAIGRRPTTTVLYNSKGPLPAWRRLHMDKAAFPYAAPPRTFTHVYRVMYCTGRLGRDEAGESGRRRHVHAYSMRNADRTSVGIFCQPSLLYLQRGDTVLTYLLVYTRRGGLQTRREFCGYDDSVADGREQAPRAASTPAGSD